MLGPSLLEALDRRGYVVLPGAVARAEVDQVRAAIEGCFSGAACGGRLTNAWLKVPAVRRLAIDPVLLGCADAALGGPSVAFQTLDFKVGTAQSPHADTIHFDTVPSGGVCAVWVALEDVREGQGPVVVYPGSHRWPVETPDSLGLDPSAFDVAAYESSMRHRIAERGVEPVAVEMDAGDVLVWSANLLHGGGPRDPGTTRWSQVTHYVRQGEVLVTPMRSDVRRGRYEVRTVIDVADRRVVAPSRSAPEVRHSVVRAASRVGAPASTAAARAASSVIGGWRRTRARAALVRSRLHAPVPR